MLREIQRYGRVQPDILLVREPFEASQLLGAPAARPFFLTDFEKHTRLIDGRWPSPVPKEDEGRLSIEVAVGEVTAKIMFWELGSEAVILPYRSDLDQQIHVTVVGLIEPLDTTEEYWMGFPQLLRAPGSWRPGANASLHAGGAFLQWHRSPLPPPW